EHHRWYCKLDVQAFFPSIDRTILLALWQRALPRLPYPVATRKRLEQVATAILTQDPIQPQPLRSGDQALLNRIPPHKSLFHAQPGKGLPIGSLTSQFFANVYMNELDQYAKHQLRIGGYIRYVDDIILLGPDVATLMAWKAQIECFLRERLALTLHPRKTVIQRCKQGADFLGAIVHPGHRLSRQRTVRALRRRISWFNQLLGSPSHLPPPLSGHWHRWLANHPPPAA
ncbi:RNA-directed DNA polymerase, partial [Aeromonas caviae]|uniref:RNA-directed DNA polymerase n=1 Tax=Aeromonas caviae TaxID=648 RepID=UPI00403F27B0